MFTPEQIDLLNQLVKAEHDNSVATIEYFNHQLSQPSHLRVEQEFDEQQMQDYIKRVTPLVKNLKAIQLELLRNT